MSWRGTDTQIQSLSRIIGPEMKPVPLHQRALLAVAVVVAGMLLFGEVLGALYHARELLTPLAASIATVGVGLTWLVLEVIQRKFGVRWQLDDGTMARHRGFGWRVRCLFLGFMLLPWVSQGVHWIAPKGSDEKSATDTPPVVMDKASHPFRFTYLRVGGAESLLSFLESGSLSTGPTAKTFTIQNAIYNSLVQIRTRYLNRDLALDCPAKDYKGCVPRHTTQLAYIPQFGYGQILSNFGDTDFTQLVAYHYNPSPLHYEYSSALLALPNYAMVSKYAQDGSRAESGPTMKAFTEYTDQLSYNLQKDNPEDRDIFFVYSEFTNRDICDDAETYDDVGQPAEGRYARVVTPDHEEFGTFILSRTLELTILDVENVSDVNIIIDHVDVEGFETSENDFLRVRDNENETSMLDHSEHRSVTIPFQVLKPGEHLLFPLDTSLGEHIGEADMLHTLRDLMQKQESAYKALPENVSIHFLWPYFQSDLPRSFPQWYRPGIDSRAKVDQTKDGIPIYLLQCRYPKALILGKRPLRKLVRDRLYFGPAIKPLSVAFRRLGQEVSSDVDEPVRTPDFKENISLVTYEVGTCPKVYTYDDSSGAWAFDTKVIVNRRSRANEGWELAPLRRFTGKILLSEEDEEISYLDAIQAIVLYQDGRHEVLRAQDTRLQQKDGQYVVLRRGDKMEVQFEPPSGGAVRGVFLRTEGYFDAPTARYR